MDNPRPEKVAVVQEVRERLSVANAALLTEYRGLKVDELARLRQAVRDAGGEYKIYKNTLARLAVRELGIDELEGLLQGPTAIAFVKGDAVLVARSLRDFGRTAPNLVIKGGILGSATLSADDASALADVAPREVLLAQLAGLLAAPLRQMAGLLQALPRNFAYGLSALIQKSGGPPADVSDAPTADGGPPADVSDAPTADGDRAAAAGDPPDSPTDATEGEEA